MSATYKGSHVDIDASHEKVVDLPHQTTITCLPELHLLEWRGSMIMWGRADNGVSNTCSDIASSPGPRGLGMMLAMAIVGRL